MFTKLKFRIFNLFRACFLFFIILAPAGVNAATLYFSPSSGNYTVGNILSTSVLVNTQSQAINNADAVINFPASLLEVISLNKSGSLFTLWVEEPAFSNSAGVISFNGGLPTPGFNGSAGRLLNITFRVRNTGLASLVFPSGAVRANDGFGTDVLQTTSQAQFNLVSEERPVVSPPSLGTPQAPAVSSPTHPDSGKWYSKSTATFNWQVPSGVDAAKLLVGRIAIVEPAVLYIPPINQKIIEDLADGVWYFHVQLRNNVGWGTAAHFRFNIDTQNPERFDIKLSSEEDLLSPRVKFIFEASDRTSGIDHYEVQIDGKSPSEIWRDDGTHEYEAPPLDPGTHILVAKAVDRAGNSLSNSVEFTVKALDAPVIIEYSPELEIGDILVIKGKTYPDSEVTVWLQRENDSPATRVVKSDARGDFSFVFDTRLSEGVYKFWAQVKDKRGAQSSFTEKFNVAVRKTPIIRFGFWLIDFVSIVIILVALIVLLILIIWYSWHKFKTFKKRLEKEVFEVEHAVHKAFKALRSDIHDQLKRLEHAKTKRELTEEEEAVERTFRAHLDTAEKYIEKEIEDVEKEVSGDQKHE